MRRRHVLSLSALGAVGAAFGMSRAIADADPAGVSATAECGELPFTKPSVAELRAATKKAFAFYYPPGPISFDNRDPGADQWWKWLNPLESGQYKEIGGLVRDRPLSRAPLGSSWRQQDFETEVRQAVDMGLDGFIWEHNPVTSDPTFKQLGVMLAAAKAVDPGFRIMLGPDLTNGGNPDPATVVKGVTDHKDHPSIYKVDGVLPLGVFAPERKSVAWWRDEVLAPLAAQGAPSKLLPVYNDWSKADKAQWAEIVMGFSYWGTRWAGGSASYPRHAEQAHAVDRLYMSPVFYEDVRPRSHVYREAVNSLMLRASFEAAINGNADYLCLMPWNDYNECWTGPSQNRGYVVSDFTAYYTAWFKTGTAPRIERDCLYYFHRSHHTDLVPGYRPGEGETFTPIRWIGQGDQPRNEVELVAFLTAGGKLTITQGSQVVGKEFAEGGLVSMRAPLVPGTTPSFALERAGSKVLSLSSKTPIVTERVFQDLVYHTGSSRDC